MKQILKQYTSDAKYVQCKETTAYKSTINREKALEDLEMLTYLMNNRYCGKEYWESKGISFEKCYDQIKSYINSSEDIYISDFCRQIHSAFDTGIVDNHLSFCSPYTGRLGYPKQYAAYFADLLVELHEDKYIVVKSECDFVPKGALVENEGNFYRTLPENESERYLVGKRSFDVLTEMQVKVNGEDIIIPVHRCRANKKTEQGDVCLRHDVKEDIDILRATCCDYVGDLTEETDFLAIGKQYRTKDKLILNYLSNEGGYNRITREFILGLNDYSHCEEDSIKLISPVTEGRDCNREWVSISESEPYNRELGTFEGTLYMLVNSETGSSGESAVLYARSLKNLVLIGENTMGCNTFGNVKGYELPNSRIVCRIPNVINLCQNPDECMEGHGFIPDYWVDSEDVEGEVLKWLKGSQLIS